MTDAERIEIINKFRFDTYTEVDDFRNDMDQTHCILVDINDNWNVVQVPSVRRRYYVRDKNQVRISEHSINLCAYESHFEEGIDFPVANAIIDEFLIADCEFYRVS